MWLTDITYIRIRTGFVYLAAILDAFSRKVIGYAVSTALDTALTLEALRMAIAGRNLVLAASTTRTRGCNTLQMNMSRSSSYGFLSAWRAPAIPTKTP